MPAAAVSHLDLGEYVTLGAMLSLFATAAAAVVALAAARALNRRPAAAHGVLLWALVWILFVPGMVAGFTASGRSLFRIPLFSRGINGRSDLLLPASKPDLALAAAAPKTDDAFVRREADLSIKNPPAAASGVRPEPAVTAEVFAQRPRHGNSISIAAIEARNPEPNIASAAVSTWRRAASVLVGFWLLGAGLLSAGMIGAGFRLTWIKRTLTPLRKDSVSSLSAELRRILEVARLPEICESDRVGVPCVIGIVRPVVVLPAGCADALGPRQLRDVLVHECAHVLRRDCFVVLLQRLAAAAFWPNPLVHWLNRRLAEVRERVCDNYVLANSDAIGYGETLWQLARLSRRRHAVFASLGILHRGGQLEQRIAGLVDETRNTKTRLNRKASMAIGAIFGILCVLACGSTVHSDEPQKNPAGAPSAVDKPATEKPAVDQPAGDKKDDTPFDRPNIKGLRITKIFRVKHSKASAIANAIKDVYRDLLSPDESKNKGRRIKGWLSVGVDEQSKTIVVSCPETLMKSVTLIVDSLDRVAPPSDAPPFAEPATPSRLPHPRGDAPPAAQKFGQNGFEGVKGRPHTWTAREDLLSGMGIKTDVVKKPGPRKLWTLLGSLSLDPNRLVRIRAPFAAPQSPAEVIEIGQVPEATSATGSTATKESEAHAGAGATATLMRELRAGDRVAQGTLLAAFYSGDVANKENDLVSAVGRLKLDEQILKAAEDKSKPAPELVVLQTRRDVLSDRSAIDRAKSTLKSWGLAGDEIASLCHEAENAENRDHQRDASLARRGRVEIRSPIDGVIVERNLAVHEAILDNKDKLFEVANWDQLLVSATCRADVCTEIESLPVRQRRWKIFPPGGSPVDGAIEEVGTLIDPTTGTGSLKGRIDNREHKLRGGQFVNVTVEIPNPPDLVAVPASAVVEEDHQAFVWVKSDPKANYYVLRHVDVVRSFDNVMLVRSRPFQAAEQPPNLAPGQLPLEALRPGERVMTSGFRELKAWLGTESKH